MQRVLLAGCVALAVLAGLPVPVAAQQAFEVVGSRALGMGGAFVAVADDPSAMFWNPAGLAGGQPAGATIEWIRSRSGDRDAAPTAPGPWQRSVRFLSLGTWPLGLSYARFNETRLINGTGSEVSARRFLTRHYGATVLQTITRGFVVGTTLKYVRGTVATGPATEGTTAEALESGANRDGISTGVFDLDASAMLDARVFRLGWTTRNLRSPRFKGPGGTAIELKRQSRLGLSILPADGVIFAMDFDVNTADLSTGPSRMLALGAERVFGPRLALRGGARWNLKGARTAVGTVGASVALRPGTWLDGHLTQGRGQGERGFGLALRAGW